MEAAGEGGRHAALLYKRCWTCAERRPRRSAPHPGSRAAIYHMAELKDRTRRELTITLPQRETRRRGEKECVQRVRLAVDQARRRSVTTRPGCPGMPKEAVTSRRDATCTTEGTATRCSPLFLKCHSGAHRTCTQNVCSRTPATRAERRVRAWRRARDRRYDPYREASTPMPGEPTRSGHDSQPSHEWHCSGPPSSWTPSFVIAALSPSGCRLRARSECRGQPREAHA